MQIVYISNQKNILVKTRQLVKMVYQQNPGNQYIGKNQENHMPANNLPHRLPYKSWNICNTRLSSFKSNLNYVLSRKRNNKSLPKLTKKSLL